MSENETVSAVTPLLRHRNLRIAIIAAPAITSTVAILTSQESNLAAAIVLNVLAGVIISSALFLAISLVARRVADDRVSMTQAAGEGVWRARAEALSIYDPETGLYVDWYLRLRLQEEIDRASRHDLRFAVLVAPPAGLRAGLESGSQVADRVRGHLRGSDLPGLLRDGSLCVVFPHTGRQAAIERRLTKALASDGANAGLACFPDDGTEIDALLEAAVSGTNGAQPTAKTETKPKAKKATQPA